MQNFSYSALPWNIRFGWGAVATLPDELDALGLSRALVLSTPNQSGDAQSIAAILGDRAIAIFDQAQMHVPTAVVATAAALATRHNCDCTVSIGGGSTTGLGKALALHHQLPNIAIPTTYAGSEMTNIWGTTEDARKVTGRSNAVVPRLVIYDPELTQHLPPNIAGPSALNAIAQAVVNLTAGQLNPIVALMAKEAVRRIASALPKMMSEPTDPQARSEVLLGACLAGGALGTGVTSLHHRLCHTLGGTYNTSHAETHTALLPHTVAFNVTANIEGTRLLSEALACEDPARTLWELAASVGAPTSLQALGLAESMIGEAASIATETPINNPIPVSTADVRGLLQRAWQGDAPMSAPVAANGDLSA